MSFDHRCFIEAENYKRILREHANSIISYFKEFADDNCEVAYGDVFTHCEKTMTEFDTRAFEDAYADLRSKKVVNFIVKFGRFDGSVLVRGKMDPIYMMRYGESSKV